LLIFNTFCLQKLVGFANKSQRTVPKSLTRAVFEAFRSPDRVVAFRLIKLDDVVSILANRSGLSQLPCIVKL
jgi:hypothetical protein